MIKVREALMRDLGHICNLEVKTQEYPYLTDVIKIFLDSADQKGFVASISDRIVGSALINNNVPDESCTIHRISILPNYQGIGVSKEILKHISEQAKKVKGIKKLRMHIPSYYVDDLEDPYNIREWLQHSGFKVGDVLHYDCYRYGYYYDTYTFERPL